MIKSHLTLN